MRIRWTVMVAGLVMVGLGPTAPAKASGPQGTQEQAIGGEMGGCHQMTDQNRNDGSPYVKWHGEEWVYTPIATDYWNSAHYDIRGGYAAGPNIGHTDHETC
jgi:hypothetical protein